jgi:hypothetical protein
VSSNTATSIAISMSANAFASFWRTQQNSAEVSTSTLRVQGLIFFNLIENINKIDFFSIRIEMQKNSIFFNIGFNNYSNGYWIFQ